MVHLAASGIFAVLVVLILMLPKIIRAIVSGYVDVKRVNSETKEKNIHVRKRRCLVTRSSWNLSALLVSDH